MNGTEKQITWAKDIQNAVITAIDTMFEMVKNDPRANTDKARAGQQKFIRAREAVAACDKASDLIEVYRDVSSRNAVEANMRTVSAIIRNRFRVQYGTAAQQALIGE